MQQKAANLQMLGDLYNIKGNGYVALQHLQAALDAYNSIQYKQVQGIYTLMGFIYARKREYHQALEKQLLALKPLRQMEIALFNYARSIIILQRHSWHLVIERRVFIITVRR